MDMNMAKCIPAVVSLFVSICDAPPSNLLSLALLKLAFVLPDKKLIRTINQTAGGNDLRKQCPFSCVLSELRRE